ncbi:hypothetical protein D3C73_977140 [compost metagenome]
MGLHRDGHVEHRDIYECRSRECPQAADQKRDHACRRVYSGQARDERNTDLHGAATGSVVIMACDRHEARLRLEHRFIGVLSSTRTRKAIWRN